MTASESGVFNWSTVFRTNTLRQMAENTPTDMEELRKIEGITNNNIERFGDKRMLDITSKYAGMISCKFNPYLKHLKGKGLNP